MAQIVGIGIATLDIINVTDGFPAEDAEVRAEDQRISRGGNATNTLVVLSQLGHHCHWGGTLGDDDAGKHIQQDLQQYQVDMRGLRIVAGGRTPTSYITLNRRNGSRTIVHYRDLPEYQLDDFNTLSLDQADWLHFEGRNVAQVQAMIDVARQRSPELPVSVEIEKPRPGIESLWPKSDVLFISRHYARASGHDSADSALLAVQARLAGTSRMPLLVCAWGDEGAYALIQGQLLHAPAVPVDRVVDTIGAGDTFNAGFIHAWLHSSATAADVQAALEQACALASKKCAQHGFDGLV
jgi:ketohexokinase